MAHCLPVNKQDILLLLGPYGFENPGSISLLQLWKSGGWEQNPKSGVLEKVPVDFKAQQSLKLKGTILTDIADDLEDYKKSKFRKILSKIQDLDKNTLLYRIKERGLDVVSCGLGTNQSSADKDITNRKGVSGLLNFYPRWVA